MKSLLNSANSIFTLFGKHLLFGNTVPCASGALEPLPGALCHDYGEGCGIGACAGQPVLCYLCHQTTAWNDIRGVGFCTHH